MARSVVANWVWYAFIVVTGFIVPRLIDRNQGRELLGVWDLSWSVTVYVQMLGLSIGSAVSRYVARFRAAAEWERLNTTVNTSFVVLTVSAMLGMGVGGIAIWLAPWLLPHASPEVVTTARWVFLLLSVNGALQLPGGVFNGVITGHERFVCLNAIRIIRDGGTLIGCCAVLLAGGGLVSLAGVVLTCELLGEIAKVIASHQLCPQLHLSSSAVKWSHARELIVFGGKTATQSVARGGIYQGSSLLVAAFMGPAALAVYSRQRALVMHVMRFVKQYAQVLTPRSSSLDAHGDTENLRATFLQATRFGFFICLPIMTLLLILGGALVEIWMGPNYRVPTVLAVMVLGHSVFVPQMVAYNILMGMGRHGVPALLDLSAAMVSVVVGWIVLDRGGGLTGAAVAMTLPLMVSAGWLTPWYACRRLGLPYSRYLSVVVPGALFGTLPAVVCLLVARLAFDSAIVQLLVGAVTAGPATLAVYWRYVLPTSMKAGFVRRIPGRRTAAVACLEPAHGHDQA